MTTATATTTAILALDLGKYKGVACVYQPGGGEARPADERALGHSSARARSIAKRRTFTNIGPKRSRSKCSGLKGQSSGE